MNDGEGSWGKARDQDEYVLLASIPARQLANIVLPCVNGGRKLTRRAHPTPDGQCKIVRQDRHDITELQFRLQFRAVQTSSRTYARTL